MTMLYGAWILILTLTAAYLTADGIQRGRRVFSVFSFVFFALCYMLLQYLVDLSKKMSTMPGQAYLFTVITVTEIVMVIYMFRWRRVHVSPMSIKNGLDMLSDGLCYYRGDGRPVFTNQAMNEISREVTGHYITDGRILYESLKEGKAKGEAWFYDLNGEKVLGMPGGSVYRVTREERSFFKEPVYELIAYDITEEYELGRKLEKQNAQLSEQKTRLQNINDTIADLTIKRETLQAKIDIHGDLGKALVAVRSYMQGNTGREEVLSIMDTGIALLETQSGGRRPDDYETVLKAARDLGVTVKITGELPAFESGRQVIAAAMRECITNTFRHAKGDTLYVSITKGEYGEVFAEFTNNGRAPEGEIEETGGLKYLRTIAGQNGAEMEIESAPRFALRFILSGESADE